MYFSITNLFSFFLVGQMSLSILPDLSSLHFQVFVVKSKEKWSIKCYQIRAKIFLYLSSKFLSPSIFFDVINVKLDLEKKLEKRDIVSKMRKWIVGLGGLVQSTAVLPNQPFLFCVEWMNEWMNESVYSLKLITFINENELCQNFKCMVINVDDVKWTSPFSISRTL